MGVSPREADYASARVAVLPLPYEGTVSYGAALWAFTLNEVANVTAIREMSVVFGAIFGAIFLKEAFGPRRILAASGLAFGLMLLEFAP